MIAAGHRTNFHTLQRAFRAGDVALVECNDRTTGAPVYTLCAMQQEDDGAITMVPLGKLFDGNPYEEIDPPA